MNILDNVDEQKTFRFADNSSARNVKELCEKIRVLPDVIYRSHVSRNRNDFSRWINDNYRERKLAMDLAKCPRKGEIVATLQSAISDAKQKKEVILDAMAMHTKKEHDKLLGVISKPKTESPVYFIPDSPFFNIFNRKNRKSRKETPVFVPVKSRPAELPRKNTLMDEVISTEPAKFTEKDAASPNSNVFKESNVSIIQPKKASVVGLSELLVKIKEVHR